MNQITGVVFAGGQSTRMGQPKAALVLGGETLLHRVTGRLQRVFDEVIVIGPANLSSLVPDLLVVPDVSPGLGPLAGLESALRVISTPLAFVVACDMPFIQPALVAALADYALAHPEADVVTLASANSRSEHLHTIYRATCSDAIAQQISAGKHALHDLFARVQVQLFPSQEVVLIDPQGLSTFNVNTPEEWAYAQKLAAQESEKKP